MNDRLVRVVCLSVIAGLTALVGCGGGSEPTPREPGQAASGTPSAPPGGTAASDGPRGTAKIVGTVRFEGQVPPMRPIKMDADPGCSKKHATPAMSEALVLGEGQTMANVFVQIKGGRPEGRYAAPADPVVLDQEGCRYIPHVAGVMVGQPLKILNSDGLLHNVHALPEVNQEFNMAMPATRTEAETTFAKPEAMFKIKCDVHPWMGAFVSVVEHPFFDVTGLTGGFEIAGLPAGTYEIEAWHEKLGTRTASVTLADGATESLDLTFAR